MVSWSQVGIDGVWKRIKVRGTESLYGLWSVVKSVKVYKRMREIGWWRCNSGYVGVAHGVMR